MQINDRPVAVPEAWREATLLEFLRDHLGLTGTKFGCGIGACGACTVHVNGSPARACLLPVSSLAGQRIGTIEGLAPPGGLHPVQQAWMELNVPQCGYCQAGQVMAAAALLAGNADPTERDVVSALSGHLCRCGTYVRIREGVLRAAEIARAAS